MKKTCLFLISFLTIACVPMQETEFNEVDLNSPLGKIEFDEKLPAIDEEKLPSVDDEVVEKVQCVDIKYQEECLEQKICQPLLDEFGDKFLSCIPIKETDPKVVEEEKPIEVEVVNQDLCIDKNDSEKFVIICHIPPGNKDQAHSICISKQGWLHGHKDRHHSRGEDMSQDYLGACRAEEMKPDDQD